MAETGRMGQAVCRRLCGLFPGPTFLPSPSSRQYRPASLMASRLEGLTLALKVAREATEVLPVLNQILGAAAHISELAEKIQKKREVMYTLIERVAIYAREIEMAVTGRTLDAQMRRRLDRLYCVFAKVESLLVTKAEAKKTPLRLLRDVFIVSNKAESLANELEGEMKLLQLLISIDTRLALSDAADKAEEGSSYVGEFRRLRGSDVQKLGLMHWRYLQHGGILVYARVRVNGELMVVRYMETDEGTWLNVHDAEEHTLFPELVRRISTVHASHPAVVQLYGLREGPDAGFLVFRSGTYDILAFLRELKHSVPPDGSSSDPLAIRTLALCYKILDAAWYLKNKHCLVWLGYMATVDSFGEPRIGLFDDIEDGEVWEDGVAGNLSLLQAGATCDAVTSTY
ncbi:hypothetical protein EXIGLDRAFT_470320 [Exidia glandulosa HHB12029]|uniref:Protein kinase domain-containing protein n=1 Tax=Exidia glandulosa HHB12029 TaxID=1314781 RepID=A0A165JYK6_EXIGL|nr:hypothetical protein EXIGLDRAFT_470320 [Exidia glandulosa HHB12029]